MQRNPHSRKGDNGAVAIIGGSKHMHGAPLFAALSCEASGVDLLYPCVPACHAEVTKNASCNFITYAFRGNDLSTSDVSAIEEVLEQCSALIIGPGLALFDTAIKATQLIIKDAKIPIVVDGGALQPWTLDALAGKQAVVTPHLGELGRMQGQIYAQRTFEEMKDIVRTIADTRDVTILLKGPTDVIASPDGRMVEVKGGNAGLTVGGTGDTLAGLIGGLIAQGIEPCEACIMGTTLVKHAAVVLFDTHGYAFTARDVIGQIPRLLHTYDQWK